MSIGRRYPLIAVLVLSAAMLLVHPVAEVGMDDDWSFIRTAFDLARTGHLTYNGWAAPIIGFQAYWGALFIRLFGFSFTLSRFAIELLTLICVPLLMRLFCVAGLQLLSSFFAVLTLLLSPLMLPLGMSFMTDMPAFLLFSGALLCSLEAWACPDTTRALQWMWLAAVAGALSGSVRQIYWAAILWALAVLIGRRFRTRAARAVAMLCFAATFVFALAVNHWQSVQPYTASVSPAAALADVSGVEALRVGARYVEHFFVTCALLLLPISAAFFRYSFCVLPRRLFFLILAVAGVVTFRMADPLPWLGNLLSQYGILRSGLVSAGVKQVILPPFAMWAIGSAAIAGLAWTAAALWRRRASLPVETAKFAVLTLPFLALYVAAIAARGPVFGIYDRYSIPVVAVFIVLLLSAYQQQIAKPIPALAWATLSLSALYAIATTHDSFSAARARLETANALRQHYGAARDEVQGGFEFDCWTQVEKRGYVNNQEIQIPPNAYQNAEDCSGDDGLQFWWRSLAPAVKAKYVVTLSPLPELEPQILERTPYQAWLPYGTRYVYAQRAKTQLACVAE